MSYPEGQQRLLERMADQNQRSGRPGSDSTHVPNASETKTPSQVKNKTSTCPKDTKPANKCSKKKSLEELLASYKPSGKQCCRFA